jgi:hypothetical protein
VCTFPFSFFPVFPYFKCFFSLSFFLSISLTLLRLYTNHHERAAWTWRTISASKSLLMPAFLPVCLEREREREGVWKIFLFLSRKCASTLIDITSSLDDQRPTKGPYRMIYVRIGSMDQATSSQLKTQLKQMTVRRQLWRPIYTRCCYKEQKRMKMANSSWEAMRSQELQ